MPLTRAATLDASKFSDFLNSLLSFIFESNGSVESASRSKLLASIAAQYFPEAADTEDFGVQVEEEVLLILKIFLRAEKESFDAAKLESVLKQTDLSAAQKKIFLDMWGTNKEKIWRSVTQGSMWTHTLDGPDSVQWRVDRSVTTSQATDAAPTLASAAAVKCLLSLKLRSGPQVRTDASQDSRQAGKALLLELSKAQVDELLATLEVIQQQIDISA